MEGGRGTGGAEQSMVVFEIKLGLTLVRGERGQPPQNELAEPLICPSTLPLPGEAQEAINTALSLQCPLQIPKELKMLRVNDDLRTHHSQTFCGVFVCFKFRS